MLSVLMLSVAIVYAECRYPECRYAEFQYAECPYAECHYPECRCAECRGALWVRITRHHFRHNLWMSLISLSVFPWQAFPVSSNVCGARPGAYPRVEYP
jgi:hypothetical protein